MKVLRYQDIPTRLPITPTGLVYLLLDHFHATPEVWSAIGVLMAVVWIGCIVAMTKQEQTPVQFKEPR